MKILQINATNGTGSIGRTTLEMADYLNNNGHDCYIAYAEGHSYHKGYKIGNNFDRKIHALFSRIFGLQAYFSLQSTKKLTNFIKNENFDVIHLRNLHHNYINLRYLLNFIAVNDIATVITLHDCWAFTGKCTYYTTDNCYRWQEKCGNCVRLKKDNTSWFFDMTSKMLKDKKNLYKKIPRLGVVGVSDWVTNEARKSILKDANYITRIYNWISDDFHPVDIKEIKKSLSIEDKFVILGVATKWSLESKSATKGLDIFIQLSYELPKDMIIILVGELDKSVELPSNIINIPKTNKIEDLVKYYSLADVFLNPSKEETFGKVTAEALLCGTPAIVTNSTANPELVKNSNHILTNFENKNILKIIHIIKQNKIELEISYYKEIFNKHKRIQEYIILYNALLNKK